MAASAFGEDPDNHDSLRHALSITGLGGTRWGLLRRARTTFPCQLLPRSACELLLEQDNEPPSQSRSSNPADRKLKDIEKHILTMTLIAPKGISEPHFRPIELKLRSRTSPQTSLPPRRLSRWDGKSCFVILIRNSIPTRQHNPKRQSPRGRPPCKFGL